MADDWPLVRALLFYAKVDKFNPRSHETVVMDHRVVDGALREGRPVDSDKFIQEVFRVTHDRSTDPWVFTHPRSIATHPRALAWYQPSHGRAMFIRTGDKEVDQLDRIQVRHPTLLFIATHYGLDVYALGGDSRPDLGDTAYFPPYMNCGGGGHVCLGGLGGGGLVEKAEASAPPRNTPEYWEWRWWESTFSHSEPSLAKGWNYARLAAALINQPTKFPYETLVKAGTVRSVIESSLRR